MSTDDAVSTHVGPLTLECKYCKRPYTYVGYLQKHENECAKTLPVSLPPNQCLPCLRNFTTSWLHIFYPSSKIGKTGDLEAWLSSFTSFALLFHFPFTDRLGNYKRPGTTWSKNYHTTLFSPHFLILSNSGCSFPFSFPSVFNLRIEK